MKKILSVSLAIAALCSAADAKGFNGFYAGLDFGLNQTASKARGRENVAVNPSLFNVNGHGTSSNLGIFLGYNKVFANCMSVGAEYASDFNFGDGHTLEATQSRKFTSKRSTHSWSLFVKPGILINPKTLFFVGLGVKSLESHLNYTQQNTPAASFRIKSNKVRFSTQIGFENMLSSDKLALRMTYGYTPGGKKNFTLRNTNAVIAANGPSSISYKTDEHLVKLGLSYRF